MALAMTFVILTAGIDLSVGSVLALGATITAKVLMDTSMGAGHSIQILFAVAAAIGACTIIGVLNGVIISQFAIQPFVVTLAAMIGVRGFARWMSDNQNIGLSFDATHVSGRFVSILAEPYFVILLFIGLSIAFGFVLSRTVLGRYIRAVGDNVLAANYAGLPIKRIQVLVYALSGAMAGVAGVLHCAQNSQGNPNDGIAYELDAIAAVVIGGTSLRGGKGTIFGTTVGTLILGVITNILGLKGVDENVKWMTKAAIIVVAVLLQQTDFAGRALARLRLTKLR